VGRAGGYAQEKIGGALGWLGGRWGDGGAVGGGSSVLTTTLATGGSGVALTDARIADVACRAIQSGQIGQSDSWDGAGDGTSRVSLAAWQSVAPEIGSIRGTLAPAPSCTISASSTANRPDKGWRRIHIAKRITTFPCREGILAASRPRGASASRRRS
jgi:hypothetical protein